MIKLIVSDMDGTLLNERVELSDENAQAVKRAQAAGIDFVIATGRSFQSGYNLVKEKGINCPFIGQNGGTYYNENEELQYIRGLSKDAVRQMMAIFDQIPVYYELVTFDGPYSNDEDEFREHFYDIMTDINHDIDEAAIEAYIDKAIVSGRIKFVDSYDEVLDDPDQVVLKVAVQSTAGSKKLDSISKRLEKEIDDIAISASSRKNLEINHIKATKGRAVAEYAQLKGYDATEVMTIGDNINDLTMLDWAKYGTAMENAVPEAKTVANYTTLSNSQNGVAHLINRVLSGEIYEETHWF